MNGKIIYVDFIKKRRITFLHYILNKFISWFPIKFYIKTNSLEDVDSNKRKQILN